MCFIYEKQETETYKRQNRRFFLIIKTFLYNQIYIKLLKTMLNENNDIKFNQLNVYYLDYKSQIQSCKEKEKQLDRKSGKMYESGVILEPPK